MRKITVFFCVFMCIILFFGTVSAEIDQQTLRKISGQTLRMKSVGSMTNGSDLYLNLRQYAEKHFDAPQIEGLKEGDRIEVMENWTLEVYSVEHVEEGYLIRDDEFEYLFSKQKDGTYTGMRKIDEYSFKDVSLDVKASVLKNAIYIKFSEDGSYAVLGYDELVKDADDHVINDAEAGEFTFNENGDLIAVQTGNADTEFLTSAELSDKGLVTDSTGKNKGASDEDEHPVAADKSENDASVTAAPNRDSVNLRAEPNKTSKKLAEIRKGTLVHILDETKGKDGKTWYLVEADGLEGYIRSDMLTKQSD